MTIIILLALWAPPEATYNMCPLFEPEPSYGYERRFA